MIATSAPQPTLSRRSLIRIAIVTLACPAIGRADASDGTPLLTEDEDEALELCYVSDVARLDRRSHPEFSPGQRCQTCDLYRGGANSSSGPCKMFSGQRVSASGWCSGYEARAPQRRG